MIYQTKIFSEIIPSPLLSKFDNDEQLLILKLNSHFPIKDLYKKYMQSNLTNPINSETYSVSFRVGGMITGFLGICSSPLLGPAFARLIDSDSSLFKIFIYLAATMGPGALIGGLITLLFDGYHSIAIPIKNSLDKKNKKDQFEHDLKNTLNDFKNKNIPSFKENFSKIKQEKITLDSELSFWSCFLPWGEYFDYFEKRTDLVNVLINHTASPKKHLIYMLSVELRKSVSDMSPSTLKAEALLLIEDKKELLNFYHVLLSKLTKQAPSWLNRFFVSLTEIIINQLNRKELDDLFKKDFLSRHELIHLLDKAKESNYFQKTTLAIAYELFKKLIVKEKIILKEAEYATEYQPQDVYWEGRYGYILSEAREYQVLVQPEVSETIYTEKTLNYAVQLINQKKPEFKKYLFKKLSTENKELYEILRDKI